MTDEELIRFVTENADSEDEAVQKEVEQAWKAIMERSRVIEQEAMKVRRPVPREGKTSLQVLNELMERIREEEDETPDGYRTS